MNLALPLKTLDSLNIKASEIALSENAIKENIYLNTCL